MWLIKPSVASAFYTATSRFNYSPCQSPKQLSQSGTNNICQNYAAVKQFRIEVQGSFERLTVEVWLAISATGEILL